MKSIFGENFLVDTNLLAYAFNKEAKFHGQVRMFFNACVEQKQLIHVAQQSVVELTSVLVRKYGLSNKISLGKVRTGLINEPIISLIYPLPTTLETFFRLVSRTRSRDIYDLFLAATALDNGVGQIVTNNPKDFRGIKDLKVWGLEDLDDK